MTSTASRTNDAVEHEATRLARTVRVAAAVAGAVLALGACGTDPSGADAPKDAEVAAFCDAVADLDVSDPEQLVEDLSETGTPKGIPDDARAGFELLIDKSEDDEISDSDQAEVTAFVLYATETCAAS